MTGRIDRLLFRLVGWLVGEAEVLVRGAREGVGGGERGGMSSELGAKDGSWLEWTEEVCGKESGESFESKAVMRMRVRWSEAD